MDGLTRDKAKAIALAAARLRAKHEYVQPDPPEGVRIHTEGRAIATPEDERAYNIEMEANRRAENMSGGIAQAISPAAQGASFGFMDEAVAGAAAPIQALRTGNSVADEYAIGRDALRGLLNREREENPVRSTVTEIAGALPLALTGVGAGGRVVQGASKVAPVAKTVTAPFNAVANAARNGSMLTRAGAGATIGAAQGATYGFGSGEGGFDERADSASTGAILGAAGGVAAPVIGKGVQKGASVIANRAANKATVAAAPTIDDLAARSDALFRRADDMGVVVRPESYQRLAGQLRNMASSAGVDPGVTPASNAALGRVLQEADAGVPLSLQKLNTVRAVIQNAAGANDPNERRIASMMLEQVDGFIDDLTPDQLVSNTANDVGPVLREARSLWGRMRRTQMVDEATEKAARRAASTGSGGNVNNAIRQNLRAILDNPTKRRGFSDVELQAMEDVVRGTPSQNALRLIGKLSPQGNGLMLAANLGAAAIDPITLGGTAVATGAKALADRGTQQSTNLARALVASGGNRVVPASTATRGKLAELLLQRNAPVTGQLTQAYERTR